MENDLAVCGVEGAENRPAGGRLAGAAFAHQSQRFPLKDVKADAIHGLHGPGALAQKTLLERIMFFQVFYLEQDTALFRHPISPVHIKGSARYVCRLYA